MSAKEARKLWVKALRSGEYEQTRGQLRKRDSYCCLGVACDLHMKHVTGMDVWEKRNGILTAYRQGQLLPENVRDWLGLSSVSGEFSKPSPMLGQFVKGLEEVSSLIILNDSGGSFDNIADIIESGRIYLA